MAVSVQLTDPARVAGFVTPGSKVAVFLSSAGSSGTATAGSAGPFTRLLLPNVEVIGVGSTTLLSTTTTTPAGAQTTQQVSQTILTLALTQKQAQQVIFASGNGTLALGLLNAKSKVSSNPGTTSANLFK
ncbi:MAG: RcpC/CpaB family pilus assembly protein [Nocardioidaceae bacterium]